MNAQTKTHHYNNQFCNNCGKNGHVYSKCTKPITSVGVIAFNKYGTTNKFLLICRKDSLGYVEFIRGKYPIHNRKYIQNIINEMTIQEKTNLLTKDFSELWKQLWGDYSGVQYRSEEKTAKEKFHNIKDGIHLSNDTFFNLESLIKNSTTNWIEPEWGFPKGRRNYQENDYTCALREYSEETGHSKHHIMLLRNIIPFDEIFTGSNFKSYKNRYFLGYVGNTQYTQNFQKCEVSKMRWMTLDECIEAIRPYNLERIELIKNIDKILHKYSIIS